MAEEKHHNDQGKALPWIQCRVDLTYSRNSDSLGARMDLLLASFPMCGENVSKSHQVKLGLSHHQDQFALSSDHLFSNGSVHNEHVSWHRPVSKAKSQSLVNSSKNTATQLTPTRERCPSDGTSQQCLVLLICFVLRLANKITKNLTR